MATRHVFHLSIPVADLSAAERFYTEVLGARIGRRAADWLDVLLWGHQITLQLRPGDVLPLKEQGKRHFGVALPWSDWESLADRLQQQEVSFLSPPSVLLAGTAEEQAKFYLADPFQNIIEVKAYRDMQGTIGQGDATMNSNGLPQSVLDAADTSAITQLILLERDCRDLGRWERMRQCFHADSLVRLSWYHGDGPGFVAGSIDMAKRGMLATHRLGPILIRLAGDRAIATLSAIIDIPTVVSGIEALLSSHARLLYRVERRDEGWKIFGFDAVYTRDALAPTIPGQQLHIPSESLAGYRRPYRMLSFVLAQGHYGVNGNLPGVDRPDLVDALERELFAWAGVTP